MIVKVTPRIRAIRFTKETVAEAEKLTPRGIDYNEETFDEDGWGVGWIKMWMNEEELYVHNGDWIVRHGDNISVLKDDEFKEQYEICE